MGWPAAPGTERAAPISLRTSRLSGWEPMTPEKFELMALDRGVIGNDDGPPERVTEPEMTAVAVSPQGFVFRWD